MGDVKRQIRKHVGAYSETEIETGKEWIDGKKIFRKVIDCGALPNNTSKNVAHGIASFDSMWISADGSWATEGSNWIPLPYVDTATTRLVEVVAKAANVNIVTASDMSAFTTSYVTLEYTK